jgi:hypothetical protein
MGLYLVRTGNSMPKRSRMSSATAWRDHSA